MKTHLIRSFLILICFFAYPTFKTSAQLMEFPPYSYNEYRVETYNVTQIERYINEKKFEDARIQLKYLQGANYKNYKLLTNVKLAYFDGNKKTIKDATENSFKNGVTLKEYTDFVSKFQKEIPKTQLENYQDLRKLYLKSTNQAAIKKLCMKCDHHGS